MSTMIERIARILEPQAWAALGLGDTLAYKNRRTSSLRKARAAIEAMREPSRIMIDGAYAQLEKTPPGIYFSMGDTWRSMIDAALYSDAE